jgi:hypothetical protein
VRAKHRVVAAAHADELREPGERAHAQRGSDRRRHVANRLDRRPVALLPGGAHVYDLPAPDERPRFYGPNWDFDVFVGTDPQPGTTGNFTIASGNLAEIFLVADPSPSQFASEMATNPSAAPPSFNVTNATCAEYYLRVVIHRYPGPDDAGVDAYPASGGDASLDAGVD